MSLLNVKPYDNYFYEEHLKDFLPDTFIDCHTHIWREEQNQPTSVPRKAGNFGAVRQCINHR